MKVYVGYKYTPKNRCGYYILYAKNKQEAYEMLRNLTNSDNVILYVHSYMKPKIYRHIFSINKKSYVLDTDLNRKATFYQTRQEKIQLLLK